MSIFLQRSDPEFVPASMCRFIKLAMKKNNLRRGIPACVPCRHTVSDSSTCKYICIGFLLDDRFRASPIGTEVHLGGTVVEYEEFGVGCRCSEQKGKNYCYG
jgi:hypothetical protein